MNNWRRGRLIGRGSSASVYLATDSDFGELFAVKSFNSSNSQCAKREQSILSSLNSPFIISYFGSDISRDSYSNQVSYNLFMEFASGGSLSDKIKRYGGKLDELSIRYHTHQILSALSYLHEKGIIHRDIKGQNVLIDSNGRTKIADFGCAKHELDKDETARFCGTPMFMAPEAAIGEEQGKPSDVWALGCVIIEMATGGVLWPGFSDPVSLLHHIGSSSEAPLFPDWISEQGKDFLSKCLSRDPRERWSAEKLLNHPFVAEPSENCAVEKTETESWISPKSVLDREMWESSLTVCERTEVLERIGMLITDEECECPDWTADEHNWINVREHYNYEVIMSVNTSDGELICTGDDHEGDLISTGDDYLTTGDDHESDLISIGDYFFRIGDDFGYESHEFDFVNENDLLLLEIGCWGNETIFLDFVVCYCCNESKIKVNELIKLRSFCCWHNSICFLVIFMID